MLFLGFREYLLTRRLISAQDGKASDVDSQAVWHPSLDTPHALLPTRSSLAGGQAEYELTRQVLVVAPREYVDRNT